MKTNQWLYDSKLQSWKRLIIKDGEEFWELKDSCSAPVQNWGGIEPYMSVKEYNKINKIKDK